MNVCPGRSLRDALASALLAVLLGAGCSSGLSGTGRAPAAAVAPPTAATTGGAAATGAAAPSAEPALRAKVAFTAFSPSYLPWWIAQEAGYYREQGLDVELTAVNNTSRVLQAMLAGEIHLSTIEPAAAVQASLAGAEIVMLVAAANRLIF